MTPARRELIEKLKAEGIRPTTYDNWRRRHPDCEEWTEELVIAQIVANRDQSAVAKRHNRKGHKGFIKRESVDE